MDENRARDAQSSTASGQSCSVPSGSGPGRGGGGADSIVPANVIAIMWWGKMAGWPAFDGSILPSIDPKNTARLFCAPSNCCWGRRENLLEKLVLVCCVGFFFSREKNEKKKSIERRGSRRESEESWRNCEA